MVKDPPPPTPPPTPAILPLSPSSPEVVQGQSAYDLIDSTRTSRD